MTDRVLLVLFAVVALAGGAGVIAATHDHFVTQERAQAAVRSGLGAVKTANVRRILATIAAKSPAGALVQDFVVKPDDAIVNVEDPAKGSLQTFGLDDSGKVYAGGTSDASADYGVRFAQLDPALPERIARAALARAGQPETALAEVTAAISPAGPLQWVVSLQHTPVRDRSWITDARGGHLRRNG